MRRREPKNDSDGRSYTHYVREEASLTQRLPKQQHRLIGSGKKKKSEGVKKKHGINFKFR